MDGYDLGLRYGSVGFNVNGELVEDFTWDFLAACVFS